MKRLLKISTALLLAIIMAIPAFTFSVSAAGQVYTIGGVQHVFLGAGETVSADVDGDGTNETYNTYSTLTEAVAAIASSGGVIGIVGEFTDPTTNGDKTFSDVSGRKAITIKGIGDGAALKFNHTLDFKGETRLENFNLWCLGTKYVFGGGNTTFGSGMTKSGGIYYGNTNGTSADSVVTTFDSASFNLGQIIMSGGYSAIGSSSKHGNYEFIFNNYNCTTNILLGLNNVKNTVYGNINCIINGGTYSTKNIRLHASAASASTVTGAISVIFNNGMADGFTVEDTVDFIIKSGVNGTASIKTSAAAGGAPTFKFTPNEGYAPAIDGVMLLANTDGEYLLSPSVSDSTQTFEVSYLATSGDGASAAYYSIDGVKTGFVKAGGGEAQYNGMSVVAFDTIQNALIANTNKADVTLIIIGESTREGLNYANKYPSGLLTIKGADENAVLRLGAGAHPWGNVKIENIALDISGEFCPDGNLIVIGEGVSGTMPKPLWGGGASSPHGGNIEIHSGTWEQVTVGSNAATSATSSKTQSHALAVYGGDFTNARIDFGSAVSTTVPKNMIFTVYGGTFAKNQQIFATNITSVGGVAAAIFNDGLYDSVGFVLPSQFKYVVKSGENGEVSFDGAQFVVTPDDGYAAVVNGKLSLTNTIVPDETAEYTVTYIKSSGTAKAYTVDGVKTAYVKNGGGLFKLDDDGNAFYAYSEIREAVVAAVGGRVYIIGEYTGALSDYWGGSGVTEISSYDENSVLTLSSLYMWTPLVFKNIKLSGSSGVLNGDSRPIVMDEGVEVVGNGLQLYGSTGKAARATDVTVKSGKYSKVIGGNVGTTEGLSISLKISGGDFTAATVNLGNESASTLNGNAILELSGGVFADGQEIKYSNLTTNGNAIAIVTNDVDKTYNLAFASGFDYVFKVREGGSYSIKSAGGDATAPTLVFTADKSGYAPVVNGTQVIANASGEYAFTPELSDATQTFEITWKVDDSPRVYLINEIPTVFVSTEDAVVIGEESYYPFDTLTAAVTALAGVEGKVILASDVSNTGGDGGAFVDKEGRKPIVIEGLTGNEVLSLDGTFGFKGDVTLDNFTLAFMPKSLWAKYINGFGNTTFGKDFKIDTANGAQAFFAPLCGHGKLDGDVTVRANGGNISVYNAIGTYKGIPEGSSITNIIDGATVAGTFNIGYAESITSGTNTSFVEGAVNIIINTDTLTGKTVALSDNKNSGLSLSDGVFTLVFNNGISGYTVTDSANALIDYIVYSDVGGEAYVFKNGTSTTAPTFLLVPDEGYAPMVGDIFIEETEDGYLYTPEFSAAQTEIEIEWMSEAEMAPMVYEIDGERYAFVKSGGGVVYYDGAVKFAFADINKAVAALGTGGGNVKVYGAVQYLDGGDLSTNKFTDVAGRSKVTITGIDGSNAKITYYVNADLAGDLEVDNIAMHRLSGTLYDTGFITKGFELILGKNLVTTTDFSQNMTIHGVSGSNVTFTEPQVITIKGGHITRVLPGTTWSASTVNGDSVINIEGGAIDSVFGGSHGGQNYNSIINGDATINISGGSVGAVYSGGNSKSVINGNVLVNVSGGRFASTTFRHGNATDVADNKLNGHSAFVFSDGEFIDAKIGDLSSRGVTGEEIFVINNTLEGYTVSLSDKGTVIYYDPDGTVIPAFDEDGEFIGYEILCDIEGVDIVVDGEKVYKTENNIYTIGRGEHTVLFSTLWEIEFDLNGASGETPVTVERYNDSVIELYAPDASKKNHYFNGWSEDKDAVVGSYEYTVPNEASVLYAIWTEIKPELTENSNIENSDASEIIVTSIGEDEYETNASVKTAVAASEADAAIYGGADVAYAFEVRAVGFDGKDVFEFENGISFRIPKHVLPERSVGEFYRIYRKGITSSITLLSEDVSVIPFTEDDEYLYFTDYCTGDYTVMLTAAVFAQYNYNGIYDVDTGKYTLTLTFSGAEANYGSFGLKYDSDKLTLDSFTFGSEVVGAGEKAVAAGGFGTYYSANGIYQNTWVAENNVSIEAEDEAVEIGSFVFTAADGFELSADTFECADFSETGIELDQGTLETVFADGYYLYAPCVPSADVYCQPIKTEFDIGLVKYDVTASIVLERSAENGYAKDEESGYANAGTVVIKLGDTTVFGASEDTLTVGEDSNGKAVLEIATSLANGEYELIFTKNGYVTTKTQFTVSGADNSIGVITPVCGDIKGSYEDVCGDGVVDIDDFVRIVRGFDDSATSQFRAILDLDENGSVDVTDLAIIKKAIANS